LLTTNFPVAIVLEMLPVRQVDADHPEGGASDLAVGVGDRHVADPRHPGGEIGQVEIAGGAGGEHADIGARHHLQHRPRRHDDFALIVGAAPCQVERLDGGRLDAFGAGLFQEPDAVEHQRHHREQRHDRQAGANAQSRLARASCHGNDPSGGPSEINLPPTRR
jgi:hypothetical protein